MLTKFIEMIVKAFLDWLALRIVKEVQAKADQLADDKEAGEIDEKNVADYRQAQSRAEQIKAAKRLLDGTRP